MDAVTQEPSKKSIVAFYALLILFFISLTAACILTYDYIHTRRTVEQDAKNNAIKQTQNAAKQVNDMVTKIEPIVTQLANDLTAGTITQQTIEQALRERGNDLFGLGVMFVPTEQNNRYAPYYATKNGARELIQLGSVLDFTEKNYTRYSLPFEKGKMFLDPFTDSINNTRIVEFATPFYSTINKSQIAGIVFGNITLQQIEDLLNKLELGKQGYAFIIADDGTFVVHPDQQLIKLKIQFYDIAKKIDENLYEELKKGKAGVTRIFYEYNNNLTDQLSWLIGEPVPAPRWGVVSVLVKTEIKLYTIESKRRVIQFSLLYALALILLLALLSDAYQGNQTGLWATSAIASFIIAFLIGGTWYIAIFTAFYETESDTIEVVHDRLGLKRFLTNFVEQFKAQQAQESSTGLPTSKKDIATQIDVDCCDNPDYREKRSPELAVAVAAAQAAAEKERLQPHGCHSCRTHHTCHSCHGTTTSSSANTKLSTTPTPQAQEPIPAPIHQTIKQEIPTPTTLPQEKTIPTPTKEDKPEQPAAATSPAQQTGPAGALPGMPDLAQLASLSPEQQDALLAKLPPETQAIMQAKKTEMLAAAKKKIMSSIIPLPTGIQIRTITFEKNNNTIAISGTIWQRYPKAIPEQFYGEPAFGQAITSTLTPIYKFQEPTSNVIGWKFNATVAQDFSHAKYPFDEKKIRIQITQKDKTGPFLLIPDFQSYTITTATSLPGISKQMTLPGWTLEKSFFGYQAIKPLSNFGLYQITAAGSLKDESKDTLPTLYFSIDARRQELSSLLLSLFPIALIFMILFLILLMTGLKILATAAMISTCSGLFFSTILSHTQFKNNLPTQQFVFFEYIYFILYLGIVITTLRCFLFGLDVDTPIFPKKHFYITQLLFWPIALLLILGVSLYTFY